MPANLRSPESLQQAVDLVQQYGSVMGAARATGIPRGTLQHRHQAAIAAGLTPSVAVEPFALEPLPDELPTAEELLERRRKQFARKKDAAEARHLIRVDVRLDGPIGIAIPGDPHLDDNGTDIALIESHVRLFAAHDAILPIAIGDNTNNWVGRLARLYGQQTLGAAEAWVLAEWYVRAVRWLAMVGGNHDCWSGSGDPIKWMTKSARVMYEAHGVRLGLELPSGRQIRVNARHDFSGRSQWNTAHGPAKAAQMGWRDHVLVAGHTHVSGIQIVRDPMSGLISHALRVGSYKTYDSYAEEKGLPNATFTVCPVVVVRPQFDDSDNRLLTTFLEPETAADFLAWLRRRKSERAA